MNNFGNYHQSQKQQTQFPYSGYENTPFFCQAIRQAFFH